MREAGVPRTEEVLFKSLTDFIILLLVVVLLVVWALAGCPH
jgi:hypothetical protein